MTLAIIGGSGLSNFDNNVENKIKVKTPYGNPSSDITENINNGIKTYFLPRHGEGHLLSPSKINYRANIYALKSLGVQKIISISAVGSLDEKLPPGTFVICDQFIDHTKNRINSFFDNDLVVHVSMAKPTCEKLGRKLYEISKNFVLTNYGATYIAIEGPQFSTKAESNMYRKFDANVVGMTNMPEAKLAREAGICYSTIAMVTDFDSWHNEHEDVSVDLIIKTMNTNKKNIGKIINKIINDSTITHSNSVCDCCANIKHSTLSDIKLVNKKTIEINKIFYDEFNKN